MPELNFPNAVRLESDLYGRSAELDFIQGIFFSSPRVPVVIFGERRTGKTSLYNVAIERIKRSLAPVFVPLQIEPRGLNSAEAFSTAVLQKLASVLGMQAAGSLPLDGGGLSSDIIRRFEDGFIRLAGYPREMRFVLCVDEFEILIQQTPPEEQDRLMGLLHYIIEGEGTDLPLSLFFTMTYWPDVLRQSKPSPLFSKSRPVELEPLRPHEMEKLLVGVSGSRLCWQPAALERVQTLSGGNPYFAKLLLAQISPVESGSFQVDVPVVEDALDSAVFDLRAEHTLKNIYQERFTDAEREVMLVLAQHPNRLDWRLLSTAGAAWVTAARRLVKRHFLQDNGESFQFRIEFLKHWLANWIEFPEECERLSTLASRLAVPIDVEVSEQQARVYHRGVGVNLSAQEYRIMRCLAHRAGQIVTRDDLVSCAWGEQAGGNVSDETVDAAIHRLRKKLKDDGRIIETVAGRGYILRRAALVA